MIRGVMDELLLLTTETLFYGIIRRLTMYVSNTNRKQRRDMAALNTHAPPGHPLASRTHVLYELLVVLRLIVARSSNTVGLLICVKLMR